MIKEQNRKCKKCGEIKLLSLFVKAKSCKNGIAHTCLDCFHKQQKDWYKKNKENLKPIRRKYRLEHKEDELRRGQKYRKLNKDRLIKRRKELRLNNIEERRKKDREYYQTHKEAELLKQKKYRANNKEKIAASQKKYKLANPEKIKAIKKAHQPRQNELDRIRRKTDPKWKLQRTISNYIYQSLCGRKLGKHWEDLVGYNIDELKEHLEKQFTKGMTWENHGEWHIDHKIPIAVFNFTKSEHEDFKKCWSLSNLQPLWAKDNLIKHARLEKSFQPSLQM